MLRSIINSPIDKNPNCPNWANQNYCSNPGFSYYMSQNCQKSCSAFDTSWPSVIGIATQFNNIGTGVSRDGLIYSNSCSYSPQDICVGEYRLRFSNGIISKRTIKSDARGGWSRLTNPQILFAITNIPSGGVTAYLQVKNVDSNSQDTNWYDADVNGIYISPQQTTIKFSGNTGRIKPINCVVNNWTEWGACSKPCGGGTQVRTRNITTQPKYGGTACPVLTETQACNTQACPVDCEVDKWSDWGPCSKTCGGGVKEKKTTVKTQPQNGGKACPPLKQTEACNTQPCPVDCEVDKWSDWGMCSKDCGGGTQERSRTVKTKQQNNGKECPVLTEKQACNTQPCPVDCEVNKWSDWGPCSKPCGDGIKEKTTTVKTQPKNGGKACPPLTETQRCNTQPCPVDCEVNEWSNWGMCSKDCGGGTQNRTRTVKTQPQNGGKACPVLTETQACNTQPCPIDCEINEWSDWATCSKPCGGGTQERTRTVKTQPQNGGKACPVLTEKQECNTQPCPVDCEVDKWTDWGTCSKTCGSGTQNRTRTVKTQPQNGGKACPVLTETQACNTQPCPVDCVVNEWSNWGMCSKPCGGGTQERTRTVKTQPQNGGKACPVLTETQACNTQACPVDCKVSDWSLWDPCTKDCGGGTQKRTKSIITQPQNGGKACPPPAELIQTQACNEQACPVDCEVDKWSDWTPCSKTCGGGTQNRTRDVKTQPKNGGKACPVLTETQACNEQGCPVDCEVDKWTDWGPCSKDCGSGTQNRTRKVKTKTQNGGKACPILTETQACNTQLCPIIYQIVNPYDRTNPKVIPFSTVFGDNSSDSWTMTINFLFKYGAQQQDIIHDLQRTPNGFIGWILFTYRYYGNVYLTLRINNEILSGGGPLENDVSYNLVIRYDNKSYTLTLKNLNTNNVESRVHNDKPKLSGNNITFGDGFAGDITLFKLERMPKKPPVDCAVSDWTEWGKCSKTCGGGTKERIKTIIIEPQDGGKACPDSKDLTETQKCNEQACPVDCEVDNWTDWGKCSATCGGGTQERTRKVKTQAQNGGKACPVLTETQACNTQPCPVDCEVDKWTDWGICSKTCGSGTQNRSRNVKTQPKNGGKECPVLTETQACNTQACPVDCKVSDWSLWDPCTKDCGGGTQKRTKSIITQPQHGGQACPPPAELTQTQACNTQPCPVDCEVDKWTDWGPCSKTCGGGTQNRTRDVKTQPKNGGKACPVLTETQKCNIQPCPVDCEVDEWSEWGMCTKDCGGGIQGRKRNVKTQPQNGGKACPVLTETQACNTKLCPVDCEVDNWTDWGPCSKTCGVGTQNRTRKVKTQAQNGGKECPVLTETQTCNTQPCPVDCKVSDWEPWGTCSATCGDGLKERKRNIITQPQHGGQACPVLKEVKICNEKPCPVDCKVSEWSNWGECSQLCRGGTQKRIRRIEIQPQNGGQVCPELTETRTCNTQACTDDSEYRVCRWYRDRGLCNMMKGRCNATCYGEYTPTNVPLIIAASPPQQDQTFSTHPYCERELIEKCRDTPEIMQKWCPGVCATIPQPTTPPPTTPPPTTPPPTRPPRSKDSIDCNDYDNDWHRYDFCSREINRKNCQHMCWDAKPYVQPRPLYNESQFCGRDNTRYGGEDLTTRMCAFNSVKRECPQMCYDAGFRWIPADLRLIK